MCSSDEQTRHELMEQAQPVMWSRDDQIIYGCFDNMMDENSDKQAGAELCQAQVKLGLEIEIIYPILQI
jgi:hypothetical protein